jgi:hypothetical protein
LAARAWRELISEHGMEALQRAEAGLAVLDDLPRRIGESTGPLQRFAGYYSFAAACDMTTLPSPATGGDATAAALEAETSKRFLSWGMRQIAIYFENDTISIIRMANPNAIAKVRLTPRPDRKFASADLGKVSFYDGTVDGKPAPGDWASIAITDKGYVLMNVEPAGKQTINFYKFVPCSDRKSASDAGKRFVQMVMATIK